MGQPIFEIRSETEHIRIYANGVVEGVKRPFTILNWIGFAIKPEMLKEFRKPFPEEAYQPLLSQARTSDSSLATSGGSQAVEEDRNGLIRSAQTVLALGEK